MPDPRLDALAKIAKSAEIIPTRLDLRGHRGPGARRLARAKGSATSSSATSARSMRSPMWCAASTTATSPMCEGKHRSARRHRDDRNRADARGSRQPREARRQPRPRKRADRTRKPRSTLDLVQARDRSCCANGKPAPHRSSASPRKKRRSRRCNCITAQAGALRLQRRGRRGRRPATTIPTRSKRKAKPKKARSRLSISAKIESEIAVLPLGEREEFLDAAIGLEEPGLDRLIRKGYELLRPHDLFHRRPERSPRLDRSMKGIEAPQAAGVIHTDFEKGFIRAETIAYDDYVAVQGRGRRARRRQAAARRQGIRRRRTAT